MGTKKSSKKKLARTAKSQTKATSSNFTPATLLAARVIHEQGPLSPIARAAFDAQTTNTEQAELGGRTKSDGVEREAGEWLAIIAAQKKKHGSAIPYGSIRLVYFASLVLELHDAREGAGGVRAGANAATTTREAALKKGRARRDDLLHKLRQIARGNDGDMAALGGIDTDTRHDDALAAGLGKLAARADAVLARAQKDEATAALVSGAELTNDDAAAARALAATLLAAGVGKLDAGRARANDSAEVNLAEGKLLAEMRVAEKAFRTAHVSRPEIPLLIAGAATRHVLGTHSHGKALQPAAPPQAPTQVDGAGSPAA